MAEGRGEDQRGPARRRPPRARQKLRPLRRGTSGCPTTRWRPAPGRTTPTTSANTSCPCSARMRMIEILPADVREWVTDLKNAGVSPTVIRSCFAILSAIFTTAFNDQITAPAPLPRREDPARAARSARHHHPRPVRRSSTPQLPNDAARLLVETDIETGLRWGELTELRPADLDTSTRVLTVSRVVVEIDAEVPPRRRPVPGQALPERQRTPPAQTQPAHRRPAHRLTSRRTRSAATTCCSRSRLLDQRRRRSRRARSEPVDLGLTEPNAAGRTYRHGTITAYNMAPCRCEHCRARLRQPTAPSAAPPAKTTPARHAAPATRRAHPPLLVPPPHLETRPHRSRPRLPRPPPRPAPRPRLLAARRRRRPPNRQRTPRPRQPHHHREIPAHPPRRRRHRPHRPEQHQKDCTLSTSSGQRSDPRRLREGVHKGTQRQSSRAA